MIRGSPLEIFCGVTMQRKRSKLVVLRTSPNLLCYSKEMSKLAVLFDVFVAAKSQVSCKYYGSLLEIFCGVAKQGKVQIAVLRKCPNLLCFSIFCRRQVASISLVTCKINKDKMLYGNAEA